MNRRRLVNFLLILLFYCCLTFFFISGTVIFYNIKGGYINLYRLIPSKMLDWLPWVLFTPVVISMVKRYWFDKSHWLKTLAAHLLTVVVLTSVHALIEIAYYWLIFANFRVYSNTFLLYFVDSIQFDIITYLVTVGTWHLFEYNRRNRERELQTSRLETQLARARLDVLRMQLNPHFLFNTLHAISALVHTDSDAADRMISRLSDLLRMSLESASLHEVPLADELEFLKIYLGIEQIRFQDRLVVNFEIEPDTLDAYVPNMILQPLVENAIRHGISPKKEGGRIDVCAQRKGDRLWIEISDDGCGLKNGRLADHDKGVGLANTQNRLVQMYGDEHLFEIRNGSGNGVQVLLEIPYCEADPQVSQELQRVRRSIEAQLAPDTV